MARDQVVGDLTAGDPPVPIPNTEVKPRRADCTARESVWESRSLPALIKATLRNERGLFLLNYSLAMPDLITLYRPVGQAELDLIRADGFAKFPPRLPDQPIFYPVTSEQYAAQIARDWNTKDARSGFAGYVLRFKVKASLLLAYERHTVGSSDHQEYWIPAKDVGKFNDHIVGPIELISEFHGK